MGKKAVGKGGSKASKASKAKKGAKGSAPAKKKTRVAKPREAAPKQAGEKGCNTPSRVDVFVQEYLVDLNGRQAAIRAGYSPTSARQTAAELLATVAVQEAVTAAMVERAKRTGITQDKVLERFWSIATADPSELTEHYRGCCRYCWGKDNRYQYTPRELEVARREHEKLVAEAETEAEKLAPFDECGGVGYNPRNDPNPDCPECFGEGEPRAFFKDTRDLSPNAKRLFAGVKVTQHGLEIKTHDPMAALVNVGKHLGMFRDRVELTGKDGKDIDMGVVVLPPRERPAEGEQEDRAGPTPAPAAMPRKPLKITAAE